MLYYRLKSSLTSLVLPFMALIIVGCSQTPAIDPSLIGAATTNLPEQWGLQAKLGIRTTTDSGSVTLNWQQRDQDYRIRIQGPLGKGNATITGNDQRVTIERPGKPTVESADIHALLYETFGWTLPIEDFKYWVRGIANPQRPVQAADYQAPGILNRLEQSQWRLRYSRYQTVGKWALPGLIKADQENARLTLIIREWQLPTAPPSIPQ